MKAFDKAANQKTQSRGQHTPLSTASGGSEQARTKIQETIIQVKHDDFADLPHRESLPIRRVVGTRDKQAVIIRTLLMAKVVVKSARVGSPFA